jgi:hypothetical protein
MKSFAGAPVRALHFSNGEVTPMKVIVTALTLVTMIPFAQARSSRMLRPVRAPMTPSVARFKVQSKLGAGWHVTVGGRFGTRGYFWRASSTRGNQQFGRGGTITDSGLVTINRNR